MEYKLSLPTIDDIKALVQITRALPYNVQMLSGDYEVNGKSILSVFTLDLSQTVILHTPDEHTPDPELEKAIAPYLLKD